MPFSLELFVMHNLSLSGLPPDFIMTCSSTHIYLLFSKHFDRNPVTRLHRCGTAVSEMKCPFGSM